ncbi:MAG: hypothetical protein J6R42_04905 [Clostridia bacterium]|nr:hypothetical protein [Clostridia bacterium]
MESTTKLWKVVVEISHARSDGNGECGRETKTRYFDDFRSAEYFAQHGDIASNNYFAQVASRQIYEYDISSVRQLERKKHEVVTEVKETKWCWE